MTRIARSNEMNREITFELDFTKHALVSILVACGDTKVLCNVSLTEGVPFFLKDKSKKQGWLTAEYGMLPHCTHERMQREAVKGKQSGRTLEISRLIARSLRAMVDLTQIPGKSITVDCDVIQADGGTRTTAINGASLALQVAVERLLLPKTFLVSRLAAISVGFCNDELLCDLDYQEDSNAQVDLNLIGNDAGDIVEIQGCAEQKAFSVVQLNQMLEVGQASIASILELQTQTLKLLDK